MINEYYSVQPMTEMSWNKHIHGYLWKDKHSFLSFFFSCLYVLSRSRQVTAKGIWVIDVLVSCWLTSRLHTLEEEMRYTVEGQSLPHTYSISGFLSLWVSPATSHALLVERSTGCKVLRKSHDPCTNTHFFFWTDGEILGVIWPWTWFSQWIYKTIVFLHIMVSVFGVASDVCLPFI